MSAETWATFALASLLMGVVPGPGVVSIIGFALGSGRRVALASVAGMAVGNATAMSLSLAGAGAILASSALAFSLLKWAGAIYLVALGILTITRTGAALGTPEAKRSIGPRAAFLSNMAIGIFHPKTILFFVAFASQFIRPDASYLWQALVLVATFTGIVAVTDALYAVAASRASEIVRNPKILRWTRRAGGCAFIAAGVSTAMVRQ